MAVNDPLRTRRGAANLGAGALQRGGSPTWELADVISYSSASHTAVVRTHTGRPLRDVPQLKPGPGDFDHLKTGTTVVIAWELGTPIILGCVSNPGGPAEGITPPSLTGVQGIDPLDTPGDGSNHKPANAPSDLSAGDWAKVGTHGNFFALLEGGVTMMGSPTAQIRSLGVPGILQIITQQLQTFTDFGHWKVQNEQGRTSFILRAGSNQSTQTGMDEEHWTIRLDVGATGDLFNFEVTEPTGRSLFKFHVSPDGKATIYGDAGVDISSGKKAEAGAAQDLAGNRAINIAGNDALTVAGIQKTRVGSHQEENITGDKKVVVGASALCLVNNDQADSIGGQHHEIVVGGGPLVAKKGRAAKTTKIVNGGWLIDIGNPKDGANITAFAAFELRTSTGDIKLTAGDPGTIQLNGNEQHAVRGDSLRSTLNTWVKAYNKFVDAYSTHTHPTGTGPSGIPLPKGAPPIPNPYAAAPLGNPHLGKPYIADTATIKRSRTSPFPLPSQPEAMAVAHVGEVPESDLSKRVLLK